MAFIPLREYAEMHGRHPESVRQKIMRGGFKTAQRIGHKWIIDENEPYGDCRIKSGNYINWRKKI